MDVTKTFIGNQRDFKKDIQTTKTEDTKLVILITISEMMENTKLMDENPTQKVILKNRTPGLYWSRYRNC